MDTERELQALHESASRLSALLGEEAAKGIEHDRRVQHVRDAIAAADRHIVARHRDDLPELWASLDALTSERKRFPAYQ